MQKRSLTVGYIYTNNKPYPMIRLQGKWLEELGFRVGDRVVVVTDEERIVITKEDDTSLRGLGGSF